jgi:hypothetical protein
MRLVIGIAATLLLSNAALALEGTNCSDAYGLMRRVQSGERDEPPVYLYKGQTFQAAELDVELKELAVLGDPQDPTLLNRAYAAELTLSRKDGKYLSGFFKSETFWVICHSFAI